MYKKILLIVVLLISGYSHSKNSDIATDRNLRKIKHQQKPSAFSHLAISGGFSTMGTSIELVTPIVTRLNARIGIDFFKYNTKQFSMLLQDNSGTLLQIFHTTPLLKTKANAQLFHTHVLVDYYPFKKGLFYLTAGVYLGNTKVGVNGRLEDNKGELITLKPGKEWPDIIFDGKKLELVKAQLAAELKLGQFVKPYLGFGLGRSIPKNRLGIKFDAGVIYQGEYSISQNNQPLLPSTYSSIHIADSKKYTKWLKWWPKAAIQLSYRIY